MSIFKFVCFMVAMNAVVAFVPTATVALTQEEAAKQLEAMNWYSEQYPPYNYEHEDQVVGLSVDVLMAAFKKIGVKVTPKEIKIVPWNRSYKYIQRKPGTVLFSMTYTPEREQIMKFVGPIVPSNISVIAPVANNITVNTAEDLSELKIGVVRDDIGDLLIRKFTINVEAITRKNSLKQLLYLLDVGRVDAVAYATDVFKHALKESGGNPGHFEEILVLKEGQLGYAFHNSTDPEILLWLQKAVDELRADGTIAKISAKYGE